MARHAEVLEMAKRLEEVAPESKAAKDTKDLANMLEKAYSTIIRLSGNLVEVWKAVEWVDSCDRPKEAIIEAIREYEQ